MRSIFVKFDPVLYKEARKQVKEVFPRLLEQIESQDHPDQITEALVGHVTGLYAFMNPEDGESIQLLQKIEETWVLVTYRVEKICLTDRLLTSPSYANGLTPTDNPKANPVLIYRGTANPADEGAML